MGRTAGTTRVRRSSDAAAPESDALIRAVLPCEIRVVDEESREIELCATSEAIDAHGTIFGYDASRDAFSRWAGNVREMHERKAVGRKVAVRYDDDARKVYVRVRISLGAQDTWEKVKDGTLAGASIGASNVVWTRQRIGGAEVPFATHYDLVELSLVDLPSNAEAQGVTFVRFVSGGEPDAALLDDVQDAQDGQDGQDGQDAQAESAPPSPTPAATAPAPTQIREHDGSLTTEDTAAAIAQAALRRGQAELLRQGDVAAGHSRPEPTPRELRLARLGAPGYVSRVAAGAAAGAAPTQAAPQTRAVTPDEEPGAMYDVDGDHDNSGYSGYSGYGAGMEHSDELHAHASHDHAHTGGWDDAHLHGGAHQHLDGTSHTHDHAHDHGHHDHADHADHARANRASRAAAGQAAGMDMEAGHSHGHVHTHDHGHFYRVADGSPIDERLVSGEQLRTREYVSEMAFQTAGGVAGTGLTAAQYRIAAGVETRLELVAAERAQDRAQDRAQGAFSRNPLGAADIGTPAAVADPLTDASTDDAMAASATGQVRELNRDGDPVPCDDESSTGTLDVSAAPDGFAELTENRAQAAEAQAEAQRALLATVSSTVSAAIEAQIARALGPLAAPLGDIQQRLAHLEAQPMPGGPIFRAAEKSTPLTPSDAPSTSQQIEALQALAGRIADPQAQVAVAAEMIRLQQQQVGMTPAMQVMPRAGRGWGSGEGQGQGQGQGQ